MKSNEIQHSVQNLIDNFSKDEFVFDLLVAYGISKTSVTRLKKGDYNLSNVDGEILYKNKIFFKVEATDKLFSSIDTITKEERILKHKPRFAIVTDYKQIVAKDLQKGKNLDIKVKELPNYFDFFFPLAGSEVYNASNNNEADRNASYKMASLYDLLIEENPNIYNSKQSVHNLNIFLSRLLFCFFAEDTEIFEQDSIFTNTLAQHTAENGKDTHTFLDELFDRLDSKSGKDYPDFLAKFPYVNGGLFGQKISSPKFNKKARQILIELGDLNWKDINPDIFGSMIQAVVDKDYRSDLGMHYTSVENILKLIKPLFLDELYEEFENATTVKQLNALIQRISKIKFFDPACGSGNFLIITYKEIRLLEIKILQKITDLEPNPTFKWTSVNLSQFYGIEIDDFAHEMAILSLWLAEHQMNRVFEEMLFDYGKSKPILPLKEAGQIQQGNATRRNWKEVCPITDKDEVYVIGNPPYLGSNLHSDEQREDMHRIFKTDNLNRLDYIGTWFLLAANYISNTSSKAAFVTTNSITQGVQVPILWSKIFALDVFIHFAVKSFKWTNNAKGNAGVTVAIIGISHSKVDRILLFENNYVETVKSIGPYLIKNTNVIVLPKSKPPKGFPPLVMGNKPADDGNLILSKQEAEELISKYPSSKKYIKEYTSAGDFLNGHSRYCLWIEPKDEKVAKEIPLIKERTIKLYKFRLESKAKSTRDYAKYDFRFRQISYRETDGIIVPRVSSESRTYIPLAYLNSVTIVSDATNIVYDAEPWIFGLIHSRMHMVWVRAISGKLKTDYRYSAQLCYNTFPFPEITPKQKENLNQYVFDILDERAKHPSKTMATLYNPTTMPKGLLQAHQALDTAIEQCYRLQPFKNDTERLEYLFKQYEEMVQKDTLFAKQKKSRKKTVKK
ncbi:DNA methyltransferase [Maribacter sp. Hel_I_7]|uniref:DNA methyltransferase n=1 Tax=Maribacter sp. Hel_I_7 TaxID=1249997 RepID=UPI00047C4B3C|nr:DNA methyltransferase [Maribacter sp. Hel_I_7]